MAEHGPCPLCGGADIAPHHREAARDYFRCLSCELVFLAPAQRPSFDEEIGRYSAHQNREDDRGYLDFLSRLADPVIERVPAGARGLDYGCGPSRAMAQLLSRRGRPTAPYDPVFRPDGALLESTYDFVTCSEVLEHVHRPTELLQRLNGLIIAGGTLGVMTGMYDERTSFGTWWYRRDRTHVCFYHQATMEWIARAFDWGIELPAANVAIFTKAASFREG